MMATILKLVGRITEEGKLEVDLPEGTPAGQVKIQIQLEDIAPTWTDEELAELLKPVTPMTGKELAEWMETEEFNQYEWNDPRDGATWVEEERRKQRERKQW